MISKFYFQRTTDAAQIFHDTAGWKNLETSLKALQSMIEGCGTDFQPFVDEELLSLVFRTLTHTNRFVRETGFYVCSSLVCCGNTNDGMQYPRFLHFDYYPIFMF